ncbi:MAG TPA: phosphotransferase [Gaiellaceae bacterium]|nr:phosphotransferase [Gaiellaceae bacterium]
MAEVWSAEQHVDEERARELIRARFEELAADEVELVSEGWDYVVFRVDGEWAFRFPRREAVLEGTEREIAVLPALAGRLPVGIPAPVFVGRPDGDFPWPFYGARYLDGVEATGRPVDPVALGAALRTLHAPETLHAVGDELPADPLGRVDMSVRLPRLEELGVDAPFLVAAARELPLARTTAVCHGDLHMRQLLVDGDTLTGIVDWVDVCRSDPAVDLSVAWSTLAASSRPAFFAAYGEVAAETRVRARVVAAFLCAMLADWARKEQVPIVLEAAVAGLRRAIEES